ncbi:TGF-beta-activated kinase 1 and MAP3K7-binding protein 1-like [Ischnura elegans]|uniref:TGF-beta-activated kinase 1 and MAP3K7-binding protein 1-like n=1 Tax=Ischnura elegans TaxID=197161 RepID=UPI001ED8931C|nr:TGF-beta-activated kinase 1 and MAP3K7-binding protein 1-like [Ischnura elegans]
MARCATKLNHECDPKGMNRILEGMPIRAEIPRSSHMTYQEPKSWTDDLPVCKQSGVGSSTNQIYREDGYRQEEHEFEDRSFHFKLDDSTFLYGVFDGHNGVQAATFAFQRMAAEILLGQLSGKSGNLEIREVLRQAFIAVERGYVESIGDRLAERTNLRCEIPHGESPREAFRNFPHLVNKLEALDAEVSAGSTAVVALVYSGQLYVANVGDSRALLCKTDLNGVLRVQQLSVDHDLWNEDELLRLAQLGLDVNKIRQGSVLGNEGNTRCLGNYLVKGGFKEIDELMNASAEPVIAEPEIHGGIALDETCRFLLLMSDGLYKSLEEATGTDQVNKEIAQMTVEEFRAQSTLTGVAQAVVDKIVRKHHDGYMSAVASSTPPHSPLVTSQSAGIGKAVRYTKRDDITLLVVNFNFPLPNALRTPSVPGIAQVSSSIMRQANTTPPSHAECASVRFNPIVTSVESASFYPHSTSSPTSTHSSTLHGSDDTIQEEGSMRTEIESTGSSSETSTLERQRLPPIDKNRRINAYVDFSDYYEKVKKAYEEGKAPAGIRLM